MLLDYLYLIFDDKCFVASSGLAEVDEQNMLVVFDWLTAVTWYKAEGLLGLYNFFKTNEKMMTRDTAEKMFSRSEEATSQISDVTLKKEQLVDVFRKTYYY